MKYMRRIIALAKLSSVEFGKTKLLSILVNQLELPNCTVILYVLENMTKRGNLKHAQLIN